jgi:hypothetical protein
MKTNFFSRIKSNPKRYLKASLIFLFLGTGLAVYGNACSVRRSQEAADALNNTNNLASTSDSGLQKLNKEDVDACLGDTLDFDNLSTCLSNRSNITESLKAAISQAVITCSVERANRVFMLACLATNGIIVDRYRLPMQHDIDKCVSKVGDQKIAICLAKNGILPANITQTEINTCVTAVGSAKLEKCLRKRGFLPNIGVLSQYDINLCLKTGSTNVYDCLFNGDLVPAAATSTVDQFVGQFLKADLDLCLSGQSTGGAGAVKCLRANGKLSRVVLLHHIERCHSLVGPTKLAACLDANGILPAINGTYISQTQIDSCISEKGFENIMNCLRFDLGALNRVVSQADIAECSRLRGATGIAKCLLQNSLLPANVNQTVIDSCIAVVAANPATSIAKCLRKKGFVSKALVQGDVNTCLKLVDNAKVAGCLNSNVAAFAALEQPAVDDCVVKAGPGGIARCLKNKALIPVVLLQEHINACSIYGGMANIAACLNGSGFTDLAAAPLSQEMIDTCVANVGLPNVRKCLVAKGALAATITAEATAACTLFNGDTPDTIALCYTNNGIK